MSSADHWFCARQHGGLCLQSKALLAMHTLLPMGDSVPYCPECDSTIPEADVDEDPLCPMCGTELASDSVAVAAGGVPTPGAASGGGLPHQDSILVALEHRLGEMLGSEGMGMDGRAQERPDRALTLSAASPPAGVSLTPVSQCNRSKYSS